MISLEEIKTLYIIMYNYDCKWRDKMLYITMIASEEIKSLHNYDFRV